MSPPKSWRELPVSEVHHAEEPEDDREAEGQEPECGAEHDAVQELGQQDGDEVVHYRRTSSGISRDGSKVMSER